MLSFEDFKNMALDNSLNDNEKVEKLVKCISEDIENTLYYLNIF